MSSETDYKRWLKSSWDGFISGVEYGRGGTAGHPDLMFQHALFSRSLFVECKKGHVDKNVLWFSEIRKDQFSWLREFADQEGFGFVFVGVERKRMWSTFVLPYPKSRLFKEAFLKKEIEVKHVIEFKEPLKPSHYRDLLEWERVCNAEAH